MMLWLVILNLILLIAPLLVALPPVKQTPGMLSAAHAASTLVKYTSVALTILLALRWWRERRGVALVAVAFICAALSQVNMLEWIFPAARGADAAGIAGFHEIRDTDMVMGVVVDGRARAYPVRYLAHHHMLNDQLGATALLPTY